MRLIVLLMAALTLAAISTAAIAQNDFPAPPVPGPGAMGGRIGRSIVIGPNNSTMPRLLRGKVTIIATPAQDVKVTSVAIYFDNTLVVNVAQAPFKADYDSSSASEGDHLLKAIGHDSNGGQTWAATAPVKVRNQAIKPGANPPAPSASPQPTKISEKPVPVVESFAGIPALEKIYSSDQYGFSIRYPSAWAVKDESSQIKPKRHGSVWLVFGVNPIERSRLVVNVRRSKLDPGTTAETFVKYNSYVSKWEQKTVLGSPAFGTTDGSAESRRVIHRLIIIKDGYAWMLNCIDTSGEPATESKLLFEKIASSLNILTSGSGNGVSIEEIKSRK